MWSLKIGYGFEDEYCTRQYITLEEAEKLIKECINELAREEKANDIRIYLYLMAS